MRAWDAERIAAASGARVVRAPPRRSGEPGPVGAAIDSRLLGDGELFVGLPGERVDGGEHAVEALRGGAWGVLVGPAHAERAAAEGPARGAVLEHADPLSALQRLARAWRRELGAAGASVVAITGSTGKTSTKDILAVLLGSAMRTAASDANLNTEIGLPLAILAAPPGSEALVLEMAMRGSGQIAELTAIAEPDVGVIVNVGPAHLELLGSVAAVADAKAELIAGLAPGAAVVVPHNEPLLERHLRDDLRTITFGSGGDVELLGRTADGSVRIRHGAEEMELRPSFSQHHNLHNLLAAVAAARAIGVTPAGTLQVRFSAMRGERLELPGGVVLIDDCYNANPMSMRAALDDLADTAPSRRVALLGDMLELGPDAARLHREIGEHAAARGVELLVTAGPLGAEIRAGFDGEAHTAPDAETAAKLLGALLRERDTVLVKASRGVGLERAVAALREAGGAAGRGRALGEGTLAPAAGPGPR